MSREPETTHLVGQEGQSFDKMKSMTERLVEDNRKYDEKVRKASSIIESIMAENKKLRIILEKKEAVIDELRRQTREMEASVMKIQGDLRVSSKYKTVEARLRKELEQLTQAKLELEDRLEEEKKVSKVRVEDVKQELRHQVLLKERIIDDVTKIADKGSKNEDLIEEYVEELRRAEQENNELQRELYSIKEERNQLIGQHNKEIREIQEKAKTAMKRFQEVSSGRIGNVTSLKSSESTSNWEMRYKLIAEIAADTMKGLEDFGKLVREVSSSENSKLDLYRHKMEASYQKELIVVEDEEIQNEYKRELDLFENKLRECEKVICDMQRVIETLNEDKRNMWILCNEAIKQLNVQGEQNVHKQKKLFETAKNHRKKNNSSLNEANLVLQNQLNSEIDQNMLNRQKIIDLFSEKIGTFDSGKYSANLDISLFQIVRVGLDILNDQQNQEINQAVESERSQTYKLVKEKNILAEKISELQSEICQKNEGIEELQEALENKLRETEDDFEEIAALKGKIAEKSKIIKTLEKNIKDLNSENDQLIEQMEDLIQSKMDFENNVEDLPQVQALKLELQDLKLKIQDRENIDKKPRNTENFNYLHSTSAVTPKQNVQTPLNKRYFQQLNSSTNYEEIQDITVKPPFQSHAPNSIKDNNFLKGYNVGDDLESFEQFLDSNLKY